MHRRDLKVLADVVLLASSFLTFASGLVLFLRFHVGDGPFRLAALGLDRIIWLNLHRVPALVVVSALAVHIALNRKACADRMRRGFRRQRNAKAVIELVLYGTFGAVAVTGLVLWQLVDGSAPLAGPAPLGPIRPGRHHVVDPHNVAGMFALLLAAHHVGHRWRSIARGLRPMWRTLRARSSEWLGTGPRRVLTRALSDSGCATKERSRPRPTKHLKAPAKIRGVQP